MTRGTRVGTALAIGAILAGAGGARAQAYDHGFDRNGDYDRRTTHDAGNPVGYFGLSLVAAQPLGELGSYFDQGFGLQADGGFALGAEGRVRLRGDLGFLIYGHERQSFCFSLPVGCRIGLDLTTTNSILYGDVGPELVLATGDIEPYLRAGIGFSWFVTTSSLSGDGNYDDFASTTNHDDGVLAWTVGGGMRVRVRGGHKPVYIDLGVERRENGIAEFLTEGDIVDHPDGSITIYPNRASANLTTFRIGFSVGIPRGKAER